MGRPSGFTQEIADEICERLVGGDTVRKICSGDGMPTSSMLFRWLAQQDSFREQYARAKSHQMEAMAEELLEITDDGSNDWMESNKPNNRGYEINGEHVQRSRLRVDTRKWLMSKMAPKKYGDKQEIAHSGDVTFTSVNYGDKTPAPS